MLLRFLRHACAIICSELAARYSDEVRAQPGRLMFPKQVHPLDNPATDTPDGLSLDYLRLAAAKNRTEWRAATIDTAVMSLAFQVSDELSRAALIERRILERLT